MCSPQGTELELEYTCMCRWCAPSIERSPRWDGSTCTPSSRGLWRPLLWCGSEEAWEPPTLSYALDLSCGSRSLRNMSGTGRSLLGAAPLITLPGVTLASAAASATLAINAPSLALKSLSGTGRSLLGVCTADRLVGCDARRRICVSNALDPRCCSLSRKLGRHRPLGARCLRR